MNLEKLIEKAIREFDWCRNDVHTFHDLEEDNPRWPELLASDIVKKMLLTQLRLDGENVNDLERA